MPLDRLCLSPQCGFASCDIGNKLTEEEQWAKLKLVKEVAEEVWQDANTSFAGKSTRYSIFFDDKIHLLVGETNKGWYNIHIAIDNSKAKCKDLETIQYGERI